MTDGAQLISPETYGATLHINKPAQFDPRELVAVDIETDEADNFVGVGMCQDGKNVYYYSSDEWCDELRDFLGSLRLRRA